MWGFRSSIIEIFLWKWHQLSKKTDFSIWQNYRIWPCKIKITFFSNCRHFSSFYPFDLIFSLLERLFIVHSKQLSSIMFLLCLYSLITPVLVQNWYFRVKFGWKLGPKGPRGAKIAKKKIFFQNFKMYHIRKYILYIVF